MQKSLKVINIVALICICFSSYAHGRSECVNGFKYFLTGEFPKIQFTLPCDWWGEIMPHTRDLKLWNLDRIGRLTLAFESRRNNTDEYFIRYQRAFESNAKIDYIYFGNYNNIKAKRLRDGLFIITGENVHKNNTRYIVLLKEFYGNEAGLFISNLSYTFEYLNTKGERQINKRKAEIYDSVMRLAKKLFTRSGSMHLHQTNSYEDVSFANKFSFECYIKKYHEEKYKYFHYSYEQDGKKIHLDDAIKAANSHLSQKANMVLGEVKIIDKYFVTFNKGIQDKVVCGCHVYNYSDDDFP